MLDESSVALALTAELAPLDPRESSGDLPMAHLIKRKPASPSWMPDTPPETRILALDLAECRAEIGAHQIDRLRTQRRCSPAGASADARP
jgi:hypothetical protein